MIRSDDISHYLRHRNAIHRSHLRRIEKNRFPVKCGCAVCGGRFECNDIDEYLQRRHYRAKFAEPNDRGLILYWWDLRQWADENPDFKRDRKGNRHVCRHCDLTNKVKVAAGTLHQLINAVRPAEQNRLEIFPADFRHALIPLPLQSNWDWRTLEEWEREGVLGISAKSAMDSQGLRDYSEPIKLLLKLGRYESAWRQKAASSVQDVLSYLIGVPAIDTRWALYLTAYPPDTQQILKRIGRLYKNSCWFPKLEKSRRLFDKAEASSWKKSQLWKPGQASFKFDPADAFEIAKQAAQKSIRSGGRVIYLGSPAKRHAQLVATRESYNESMVLIGTLAP